MPIWTLSPEGQRLARDVMVTAAPAPWQSHGPHLDVSAAAKASRYNCAAGGFTHDRAQFFPLIHDAHNHWISPHALRLLHRLTTAQARQTAPAAHTAWGPHFQNAPQRLRPHFSMRRSSLLGGCTRPVAVCCRSRRAALGLEGAFVHM